MHLRQDAMPEELLRVLQVRRELHVALRVQGLRQQGEIVPEQAGGDKDQMQVLEEPLPQEVLRVPQFGAAMRGGLQVLGV